MASTIAWIGVGLATLAAVGLLLSRDWRWSLGLMALVYAGMFVLTRIHLPLTMAAAKLVTGWMATATLGITLSVIHPAGEPEESLPQGRLFRLIAAALVLLVTGVLAPRVPIFLPGIGLPEVTGSLALISLGLLHLGVTTQPLRVILGLLTVLAGFETLYAAVEGAILVAALLAVVNLGLALTGAYLINAGEGVEEESGL